MGLEEQESLFSFIPPKAKIAELWPDLGGTCALCAPTGLAAYNISGVTVHRLFQLPVEHEGKTSTYWPLPKESVKIMRNGFRHVKLIIIDEVSMLSSLNLAYVYTSDWKSYLAVTSGLVALTSCL